MNFIRDFSVTCALFLGAVVLPQNARAELIIKDSSAKERPMTLDIVGGAFFLGRLDVYGGVLFGYPVVPDGFIPKLNDAFYVEGGGFVGFYHDRFAGVSESALHLWFPTVAAKWAFYLFPQLTAFATLGASGSFYAGNILSDPFWLVPVVTTGVYWNFAKNMGLRAEVGTPRFIDVGININF